MATQLNALDRWTLIVWRASNLLGWPGLGALIAIQVHWLVVQLWSLPVTAGYHLRGATERGAEPLLRIFGARAIVALIAGLAIGLLARKAYQWQALLAALAALAYVVTVMVTLEHNAAGARLLFGLGDIELDDLVPNSLPRALLHDTVIAATIPIATWRVRRQA